MTHRSPDTPAPAPDPEHTGVWWWIRTIVAWVLLIVLVGVLLATVVVPRVTGAETFTISTGSMRPKYPPGTLIVVRPAKSEDIGVGTVITYQLESGKATVVTHRVTASSFDAAGKRLLTTQGDANNTPDEKPVQPQQVRGALWYSVPYLGYINKVLSGGQRTLIFWVVFGALVLYAVYTFGSSFLGGDKRSTKTAADADRSPQHGTPVTAPARDAVRPAGEPQRHGSWRMHADNRTSDEGTGGMTDSHRTPGDHRTGTR